MGRTRILAPAALLVTVAAVAPQGLRARPDPAASPSLARPHEWRDRSGQVWAESGPGDDASAEPVAVLAGRALLRRPPALGLVDPAELRLDRQAHLGERGHLLIYRRIHRGLAVIGGRVVVRVAGGRVRWIAADAPPAGAPEADATPRWNAGAAIQRVAAALSSPERSGTLTAHATLVWWAPPGRRARLAWRVDLPTDLARLRAPRAIVDAHDGRIVATDDRLFLAGPEADVFEVSPVVTPELSRVELSTLVDRAPALTSPDLLVTGCPDIGTCREVLPSTPYHACEPLALATPGPGGDFIYPFAGDDEPDDPLAEVMAFYQTTRALEVIRAHGGVEALAERPLPVVANYKTYDANTVADCQDGEYTGERALEPFDNAFFTRDGEGLGDDHQFALVLGQGRNVDWALDGDVVQHELGHAVMATVAPDLVRSFVDRYGTNLTPAGLHEGLPDLLVAMVSGDPTIGEYVGSGFGDGGPLRDLSIRGTCPDDVVGEAHDDSRPLTSAFWRARQELGAGDPAVTAAFDGAVLTAWSALGAFADYQRVADLTVMELEVLLGAAAAGAAGIIFAEHGLDGCGGRVVDGIAGKTLSALPGVADLERGGSAPAPFQLRYALDRPAASISLDVRLFDSYALEPSRFDVVVQLKTGDQPILWQEDMEGQPTSDATIDAPVAIDEERRGGAVLEGPFPAGVYHLMLVNRGARAVLHDTAVTHVDLPPDEGGCGCSTGDADGGPLPAALALLWAAARFSRSRARPGRPGHRSG